MNSFEAIAIGMLVFLVVRSWQGRKSLGRAVALAEGAKAGIAQAERTINLNKVKISDLEGRLARETAARMQVTSDLATLMNFEIEPGEDRSKALLKRTVETLRTQRDQLQDTVNDLRAKLARRAA